MDKHTPGPWVVYEGQWADLSDGGFHILLGEDYSGSQGVGVKSHRLLDYGAHVYPEDKAYEEVEANARLIAAAPDLYEALRTAVAGWDDHLTEGDEYPEWLSAARAALSKAQGSEK